MATPGLEGTPLLRKKCIGDEPQKQQHLFEPRTSITRFVGYTVGGSAYCIQADDASKIFERRDVLVEEIPRSSLNKTAGLESSSGPRWTS